MATQYVAVRALNRSSSIRVVQPYNVYKLTVSATAGEFGIHIANQTAGATDDITDVAYNVSAANLKTALAGATTNPDIDTTNVIVSGGVGDATGSAPYYISFYGTLADTDLWITSTVDSGTPLTGGDATAVFERQGHNVQLSPTVDTVIDLELASNRRSLAAHSAIGQWVVTAANDDIHNNALPANS